VPVLLLLAGGATASALTATTGLEDKVDAYLRPLTGDDLISGAILIARDGEILLAKGYGPADRESGALITPETKFRLGSLTKQFTAAGILVLEQQGRLRVEDPVSRFYPDYPRGEEITIHHLLSHTSGIPNISAKPDYWEKALLPWSIDEVIAWFQPDSLDFAPGERFAYSNSNYILLAGIIERVTGRSYEAFLQENLFAPAGMTGSGQDNYTKILPNRATGYLSFGREIQRAHYRDMPFMSGAGSLYSTAVDLYKWDLALKGDLILSAASRAKMFTPHTEQYGYGWFIEVRNGRKVISHRGELSGFIVSMDRFVDEDLLIVTLFNYESVFARRAILGLCDLACGLDPKPFLAAGPAPSEEELHGCEGSYFMAATGDTLRVRLTDGALWIDSRNEGDSLAVVPQASSFFWIRGLKSMARFQRDESGAVEKMVLYNSVHAMPAPRI